MGVLDFLTKPKSKSAPRSRSRELFGDDFQAKLESLAIVSRRVFAGRIQAERRSKKKGSGVEFADHRDYVSGDDFRFVDWNVYQRFGRLLVRLYEEEEDLGIYFILDCSTSMGFGDGRKFDQARRLTAALAYVGLANLDRVAIVAVNDEIVSQLPSARGKGRIWKVLQFMEQLEPSGRTSLSDAIAKVIAQHKRRGLAVLVSDLYDPAGFERGINVLRYAKFEPYVVHIVDAADAEPKIKGDVHLHDVETGEEREVTVTDAVLLRMREAYRAHLEDIQRFCAKSQVPYFAADVDTPFDELVLRVFRRGGFLR